MSTNNERRQAVESFFVAGHETGEPEEVVSPSGKHGLLIQSYATSPGGWEYTRGTVVRADGSVVCEIKRNYSVFHHSFVVKDGVEWLVTGRSYMSQTIVNLATGAEYEPEGDAYDGNAFCWAKAMLSPDGNTLAVDGCYWACPYQFKFFDFTQPACGWPELPIVGLGADEPGLEVDDEGPTWTADGIFETTLRDGAAIRACTRLARRGRTMEIVERWLSDAERARRDAVANQEAELEAWRQRFVAEDPIYAAMRSGILEHALPDDGTPGVGGTLAGERSVVKYFRRGRTPKASGDLRWSVTGQTLEVVLYDERGSFTERISFPASVEGMREALAKLGERFAR